MTDFTQILGSDDHAPNPFAGRTEAGKWISGTISVPFLQEHFGHFSTATEMIAATESEGLKLYFEWLADEGKIPR